MRNDPRILFMGTPDFAVASLGALIINGCNIVGVVTAPDKPAGRGQKVKMSSVARYARENHLELLQPDKLKNPEFIETVKALKPDIAIVVAFRMLPKEIWSIPRYGTFNLHASLLPQYRGAAPINHAIINGEKTTGNTTFLIDDKIDTGNILLQQEENIGSTDTAGELHDRLMRSGARLVVRTVDLLMSGEASPMQQEDLIDNDTILRPAPKIYPADCYIDWNENTINVYNHIRGMSPYPGARTRIFNGKSEIQLKIIEAKPDYSETGNQPASIIEKDRKVFVACQDGLIELVMVHPEGKKVMPAADYIRGLSTEKLRIITGLQA